VIALGKLRDCLVAIKKEHEGQAETAFRTLSTYVGNVARDPGEPKFRRINLSNAAFQARVGGLAPAVEFLRTMGFAENGEGYLVLPGDANGELVQGAAGALHDALNNPFFGAL